MKTFLKLCEQRASVRSFSPQTPPSTAIEYICECVRLAPSAVNRQPWRLFYVTHHAVLEQLRGTYDRAWFATVPAVFVLCKEENTQWVRPADGHPHGDIDLAIATEHLCLAATEQGLGTCWVCNFDVESCRTALQLDDTITPVAMIPIGFPAKEFSDAGRRRKSLEEIMTHLS